MRLLAIAAAFTLAAFGANGAASDQSVPLVLTVFPCAADAAAPPALRAWAMKRLMPEVHLSPVWERTGPVWQGSIAFEPGAYIFSAESPHCSSGEARWIAIPGAQRHFAVTINRVKSITLDAGTAYGSIYGYLPVPGATVEIAPAGKAGGEDPRRPVLTDGDTYQIVFLRPGPYEVRIAFGGVAVSRTVTVGRTIDTFMVRADLTADDAASIVRQQANGSRFVHHPKGQSGSTVSLELGAASAAGWAAESSPR